MSDTEYDFKHHYSDGLCSYDDNGPVFDGHLQEVYYTGNSPYIIVINNVCINWYEEDRLEGEELKHQKIYYTIKNRCVGSSTHGTIRLIDIYQQMDEQYDEFRHILECDEHHHFLEGISKINDITFEISCGS